METSTNLIIADGAQARESLVPGIAVGIVYAKPPVPVITSGSFGFGSVRALLAVFGGAFTLGVVVRRYTGREMHPARQIGEGVYELSREATAGLSTLLRRVRRAVARRFG